MKKPLLLAFQVFLLIQLALSDDDLCTSQFEDIKSSLCSKLSTGEQTCFLIDNECKNWYKECSDYNPESNFDENVCTRIQPSSDNLKKCKVETAADGKKSCVETDKACSDFTDNTCFDLDLGPDKRCVFIDGKCEEHSYLCSGLEESKCSNNIPSSNTKKCIWKDDSSGCVEEPRKCADYIVYSEKDHDNLECQSHQITTGTSNRICVLYEDKCFELYESCEKAESEEACNHNLPLKKNNNNEYIIYDWYKCVWNEGCTQVQRVCSDYKKPDNSYVPTNCRNFIAEKENSACFFDAENDKCEEVANSCENYNLIVEESKRTEEGCKSSYPEEGKKCALQNKQCKEVNIECGDFTTKDECLKFNPGKDGKKCVFKNNLCVEDYENCEAYNDLVSEADRKKADCESIYSFKSGSQMLKCVFSESKTCEQKQVNKCSDYTGTDAEECGSYPADDKTHTCVYANNQCQEKINFVYSYCGDYVGEDKSICEAIKPRSVSDNTRIETNSKCVLEENEGYFSCVKKQKQCSDAKDSVECSKITVSNYKKRCFYIKGNCIEQYKTCEDYEAAEDVLEKETCESIVIANDDLNKCVFTAGVGGAKGTCKRTRKSCSDFNIGLMSDKCVNLQSYISKGLNDHNDNTQCTFSDNVCKTELKSCLGLYETRDANEEVCKNANTSSNNVKCIFKGNSEYFSQCLEINDKEAQLKYVEKEETEKAETDGNTDAKTETDKNKDVDDVGENDYSDNAREKYVNKILLILFAAML